VRAVHFAFCGLFLFAACDPGTPPDDGDAGDAATMELTDAGPIDLISHDLRIIVEPSDDGAMLVKARPRPST